MGGRPQLPPVPKRCSQTALASLPVSRAPLGPSPPLAADLCPGDSPARGSVSPPRLKTSQGQARGNPPWAAPVPAPAPHARGIGRSNRLLACAPEEGVCKPVTIWSTGYAPPPPTSLPFTSQGANSPFRTPSPELGNASGGLSGCPGQPRQSTTHRTTYFWGDTTVSPYHLPSSSVPTWEGARAAHTCLRWAGRSHGSLTWARGGW